jgi:hypothetical protein
VTTEIDDDVTATISRMQALAIEAARNVVWSSVKPAVAGVWFGAKWQHAGFYHVNRYEHKSIEYLLNMNDEFWFGPISPEVAEQEWTRFIRCDSTNRKAE